MYNYKRKCKASMRKIKGGTSAMSKSGIVNVRMVITEEKMLSNIDKVQKLINPKSKKQIVQLDDDAYFKDLIESIKAYLIEYPKKKNFPPSVYKAAYGLVEFATNQFEENTKKIEQLIRQREQNITAAGQLKEILEAAEEKTKDWKERVKKAEKIFTEDIIETLTIVGKAKDKESEDYKDAIKLLNARISNLETNLHIEIDMERIEDRSKALSYIGIEIADALKSIPTPLSLAGGNLVNEEPKQVEVQQVEQQQYVQETTFEVKPSLWQRIKNSKIVRAIKAITRIRIVFDYSDALPEGKNIP